jgi:hypothetical protein
MSGLLWAAVYNGIWGLAWFTFMRREWQTAFAAVGQPLAWTPEVWAVWIAMTLPLGVALAVHADHSTRKLQASMKGAMAMLALFALGMTAWGLTESLPGRVLALDALVNAVAIPVASLAAVAGLAPGSRSPADASVGAQSTAL